MDLSPQLFIALFFFCFFAGLGIFFIGIGYLWQVSLQARSMKHSASEQAGSLLLGADNPDPGKRYCQATLICSAVATVCAASRTRFRPSFFAWYTAASALTMAVLRSSPGSSLQQPKLAVRLKSPPRMAICNCSTALRRWVACSRIASLLTPASTMQNSSPPSRVQIAVSGVSRSSNSANALRLRSPTSCPWLSLTRLK